MAERPQRTNRNMIVLLAADTTRLAELNLPPQQAELVATNCVRTDEAVTVRIAQTYHWAFVPGQPDPARPAVLTVEKADGPGDRLAERVTEKLKRTGQLTGELAARSIRLDLDTNLGAVWGRGHVSVGDLWSYYCRYPYLTRLRDRSVLDEGVSSALISITWEKEGFALADSYDEAGGRYLGLVRPGGDARFGQITDSTLLVLPTAAGQEDGDAGEGGSGEREPEPPPGPDGTSRGGKDPRPPEPTNRRYFGVYPVDPERYGRDLTRLSQEILQPLTSVDGARVTISVEIHAERPDGFPDDKIRVILENARTLRFDQSAFEDN